MKFNNARKKEKRREESQMKVTYPMCLIRGIKPEAEEKQKAEIL